MLRSFRVIFAFLLALAGLTLFVSPAFAATGAKIQVWDLSHSTELICTSTTDSPSCSDIRVIPDHRYRFTLTNQDGSAFEDGIIQLPGDVSVKKWTMNSGTQVGSGGDGCGSQLVNPIYWSCWGHTNWMTSLTLEATPDDLQDLSIDGLAKVTKGGVDYTANLSYQLLRGSIIVTTCGGTVVTPGIGHLYSLQRNTCYVVAGRADNNQAIDKVTLKFGDNMSDTSSYSSWSWAYNGAASGVTCSNPDGLSTRRACVGSSGGRKVNYVTLTGTTANAASSGWAFCTEIETLETPAYLGGACAPYVIV